MYEIGEWRILVVGLILMGAVTCNGYVEPRWDNCELLDSKVQDSLRADLRENNCLREVEMVPPYQTERAKRLFHRDGYVVVRDALTPELAKNVKSRCNKMAEEILKRDPKRLGNRGPYRYSMGPVHKTGHILHYPEIAQLVDIPTVTPILKAIFGNDKYLVRGARGDFNLPGAPYQALHSDINNEYLFDPAITEFPDSGRLDYRDLPTFHVVVNFILADLNQLNAPIRQIPMTQQSHRPMPVLEDEPLWMKRSTLCPIPAGSAIIRDPRAWHGGTPNLSNGIRLMPNIEYYAYWYRFHDKNQMTRSLPRKVYETLTPFGRYICREVVEHPGEKVDFSMKDDIILLLSDVLPCYYRMGLTNEDIEKYKENGGYFDYLKIDGTPRLGFYGRNNGTTTAFIDNKKDEL